MVATRPVAGVRLLLIVLLALCAWAQPSLAQPSLAQPACAWRNDLAAHAGADWPALRAACAQEVAAYEAAGPPGFAWFLNAGNGFAGVPFILQMILPDFAPEIWGPANEHFAKFGLFMDPREPARPLPRGLGSTPVPRLAEIDFAQPGLSVVTLACGSCHSARLQTDSGALIVDGAP